jgi:hypothetical protein
LDIFDEEEGEEEENENEDNDDDVDVDDDNSEYEDCEMSPVKEKSQEKVVKTKKSCFGIHNTISCDVSSLFYLITLFICS